MQEDNEELTHQRATVGDDGAGSKVETWNTLGTVTGRVRFYPTRSTREQLENAPGQQTRWDKLVVFDAPFPSIAENDRLVRISGETLTARFVRPYRFSYQVDTEIVK